MVAIALLAQVCREMTGADSLISIFNRPLGDSAHSLMVVCVLLLLSLYIGFLSVWKAWRKINKESISFERRRKHDLNKKNWPSLKQKATSLKLEESLAEDAGLYGAESHHFVRFALILKSISHPGGRLPSLSDLRALTYATEAARNPVWMLRVVISVLLIIGILGTLVGVHAAIDGDTFNMEKLPIALIPSSIAVTFTVLLIICRGMYRRRVEGYIGRLDRHTVSFYFPFFRPAEKSSVQLQEINESLTSFSNSVKGMSECISGMEQIRRQLVACGETIREVHAKMYAWQRELPIVDAESYTRVLESIRTGFTKTLDLRDRLLVQIQVLSDNFDKTTSELFKKNFAQFVQASKPFTADIAKMRQYATQIPNMDSASRERIQARWVTATRIDQHLQDVVLLGSDIAHSLNECVLQAENSAIFARKTAELYTEMKTDTEQNLSSFQTYLTMLNNMFGEAKRNLESRIQSLEDNCVKKIRGIRESLQDRNSRYSKEPAAYWYEIVFILLVLLLLSWNVSLTIEN